MNATEQAHMTELIQLISESNNNELRELCGLRRVGRGRAAMDSANAEERAIAEANREYRKRFEAGKR
jgi:hypothetical protein